MNVNSYLWYDSLNWLNLYDADAFFQFRVFNSDSRAHFHSKSFQRLIYLNLIEYFNLMERVCERQFKFVV